MAVARGGGLSPPLWAGRSTLGDKFLRIISILRLEYSTFFKKFWGGMPPDPPRSAAHLRCSHEKVRAF